MSFNRYALLTLLLAAAGVVSASQNPGGSGATLPVEINVANAPAGLAAPGRVASPGLVATSKPAPSDGASLGPLSPAITLSPETVQLPPLIPPIAGDNCDTADCPAAERKPAAKSTAAVIHSGPPAQRALAESHAWAENSGIMPTRDGAGRVIFPFAQSVPTIVCASLHVCDIELQAGETMQGAPHIGDSIRWKISPAFSGSDEQRVTHLILKPTEAGLDTNLIIPTDRRTYHLRLVSSTSRYVSSVGFYYPEEPQAWTDVAKKAKGGERGNDSGADMPTVAVNRLNFNYRIKVVNGKPQFRPLRAMDDGYHTYISMNEDLPQQEAPILVGISAGGAEQMVNYRLKGNLYIIDGTLPKLAFISGVGKQQQRVELTRDPCRNRGWLGICWDARE